MCTRGVMWLSSEFNPQVADGGAQAKARTLNMSHQNETLLKEIDILWITAGLGRDGESIAMTAATQPSIEDLVLGGIPGIPRIKLHNPVYAYENGEEFLKDFYHLSSSRSTASMTRSIWAM